MKKLVLLVGILTCTFVCTGCSSPYLPHNGIKYFSDFFSGRNLTKETEKGGDDIVENKNIERNSYFSPDNIRARYEERIQEETVQDDDLILDIYRETVKILKREGKAEEEIRATLKNKFHLSDKIIDIIMQE
ncbi:MAG: hypothetical protein NC253_15145 [Ruminococcus sp.]|nr:hypothetical protein [Ruminococcus sp.]MCM1382721.1 hypothetical protein [Muribaculaceae bacterium]MCM1480850.1 hypothetical protein [Muribaculaceae bacterium]